MAQAVAVATESMTHSGSMVLMKNMVSNLVLAHISTLLYPLTQSATHTFP